MLNLFIAVILDNFANCYNKEANLVTQDHLEQYRAVWRKYDILGTGYIEFRDLRPFISRLVKFENPLVKGLLANRPLYALLLSDIRFQSSMRRHEDPENSEKAARADGVGRSRSGRRCRGEDWRCGQKDQCKTEGGSPADTKTERLLEHGDTRDERYGKRRGQG